MDRLQTKWDKIDAFIERHPEARKSIPDIIGTFKMCQHANLVDEDLLHIEKMFTHTQICEWCQARLKVFENMRQRMGC